MLGPRGGGAGKFRYVAVWRGNLKPQGGGGDRTKEGAPEKVQFEQEDSVISFSG